MKSSGVNQTPTNHPVRRTVEVVNSAGLHARPASILAATASRFKSEVSLVVHDSSSRSAPHDLHTRIDAKSVLDIIVLGASCGTKIDVEAVGEDAQAAVDAIERLFLDSFGL